MDNQAHRLPSRRWELAVFVVAFLGILFAVVLPWQ